MSAAAVMGAAGFQTLCVDPSPSITNPDSDGVDLRTTAILQPAQRLLEEAGIWHRFAPHASELRVLRIVDTGGDAPPTKIIREFDSSDISDGPFGWNVPNMLLRRELRAYLLSMGGTELRAGVAAQTLFTRESGARVGLSDGTKVRCRLVIAADGRNSPMRTAAGIGVRTRRYGQKALAFSVTHAIPHESVATEIYCSGGPFTMIPSPDLDGPPRSAVVWMERSARAAELLRISRREFEEKIKERSCGLFGPLTLATRRVAWPVVSQIAERLAGERLVLMAEAAHVVPPIGAQGLNMSFADLGALGKLARQRPEGLGDAQMLVAYEKARRFDVHMRMRGIDALNRVSLARTRPVQDLRVLGLDVFHSIPPMRRVLMRMGLGVH